MRHLNIILFATTLFSIPAAAQYSPAAGQNAPAKSYEFKRTAAGAVAKDDDGRAIYVEKEFAPAADAFGNAQGDQYDLAIDGAFDGQTVLILAEYPYALTETVAALKKKGFSTVIYRSNVPAIEQFKEDLKKSCQVWLISTSTPILSDDHIAAIKTYFDAGHGVFIWGDNDPYYVDANRLATALIPGAGMHGNLTGDVPVGVSKSATAPGVREGHLVTTGLAHLYEGITIATMHFDSGKESQQDRRDWGPATVQRVAKTPTLPKGFTPILIGSAGNLVSVADEQDGKRLMLDGGFTRLDNKWDDAGTARFVKNAAAWLVNSERFQDTVAQR